MVKLTGYVHQDWEDMSPYLVHFAKDTAEGTAYENIISILASRRLEARNKFGIGKKYSHSAKSACFSEIPLHLLKRLAKVRSSYGIGFHKDFIVSRQGGPIHYAYKDTAQALAYDQMIKRGLKF